MPQSTKREGFVLGPKGRLRSAAKQEPPTVGETPCLYETKKSSQDDCSNFVAEREGFEPPVPLGTVVFKTTVIDHSTISPVL